MKGKWKAVFLIHYKFVICLFFSCFFLFCFFTEQPRLEVEGIWYLNLQQRKEKNVYKQKFKTKMSFECNMWICLRFRIAQFHHFYQFPWNRTNLMRRCKNLNSAVARFEPNATWITTNINTNVRVIMWNKFKYKFKNVS